MAGKILFADALDTYDATLPLFNSPSPYVVAPASFKNYSPGGALHDTNHNVFSIVSVPSVGAVPWNSVGNNHYIHVDCTQVGFPNPFDNPGPGLYRGFGNVYQALIWGGWFRLITPPSTAPVAIWRCNDSKNTGVVGSGVGGLDQSFLNVDVAGNLNLVNANGTTLATKTNFPTGATWHFLEVFIYLGDLNGGTNLRGSFQINLDGVSVMSSANAQTAAVIGGNSIGYDFDSITLDAEFDNTAVYDFGPYYGMDPQGGGAAGFLGVATPLGVRFQTLFANANGGLDQLSVVGAGSNYQAINGAIPNSTVYVKTPTQGNLDRYKFPVFSGFSSSFAIQPIIVAESDGPGSRVIIAVQNLQGVASVGTAHSLTNGTYTYYADVPFTGITPTQADTGEWGEELLN